MKLRILGCGTSSGVPRIGNDWGACDPSEPRNRRRRVSILVEQGDGRILVDTSPDLREQLLDAGFARPDTLETLRRRFGYAFEGKGDYPPVVDGQALPDAFEAGGIAVRVVDQPHGAIISAGIRFDANRKSIGYSTDFNRLTDEMIALFKGIDVWVVDALRRLPHPTHPHLDQALEWIGRVQPKRAILTHMDNSMDYARLVAELPDGVEPGYDGLEVIV